MGTEPVTTTVTDSETTVTDSETTVTDPEPLSTQAVTDGEIITDSTTTTSEIGEFTTTTVTADEEQGNGTVFDQVSANGEMTFNIFHTSLIIAMALAILTSVF
jgi:hypothetical protein